MGRRNLYESKYKGEQVDAAIDSTLRNVKGRISSSQLDSLNNVGSIGLYNIAGGATNMSHLLVTSASNGYIYQYLFGPFNEGAVSPASSNGRCNTIGVRYYDKTGWSEWKYAEIDKLADYLSGNAKWGTENIESGSITGPKIGANAVTTGKIAPGTIVESDINPNAFDSTFSVRGKLAEAKAVGDAIRKIQEEIEGVGGAVSGFKYISSIDQLPANPDKSQQTIGYIIGVNLYVYVGTGGDTKDGKYKNVGEFRGPKGADGKDGEKGEKGDPGEQGPVGPAGDTTAAEAIVADIRREIQALPQGSTTMDAKVAENTASINDLAQKTDEKISELGDYKENDEFVRVILDSEGKLLWGIRVDGCVYYAAGIPPQIVSVIKSIETAIYDKIALDERITSNAITEIKEVLPKYQDIDEFIQITLDANGKIIGGVKADGTTLCHALECNSVAIEGNQNKVIENDEFIKVLTDGNNKLLIALKKSGEVVLPEIISPTISRLNKGKKGDIVIVDVKGNGDYTSLQECILNEGDNSDPKVVIVMSGTYYMDTYNSRIGGLKNISIIGTNKHSCIVKNNKGEYTTGPYVDNAVFKLAGNVYLANLTIVSTDDDYVGDVSKDLSYCVHCDFAANAGDVMTIKNCIMHNNHFACVGIGLRPNYTIRIEDCDMTSTMKSNTTSRGTILCHESNDAGDNNEWLILRNNVIRNTNGEKAVSIHNGYNVNGVIHLEFTNNVLKAVGNSPFMRENINLHILTDMCIGNNVKSMNTLEIFN